MLLHGPPPDKLWRRACWATHREKRVYTCVRDSRVYANHLVLRCLFCKFYHRQSDSEVWFERTRVCLLLCTLFSLPPCPFPFWFLLEFIHATLAEILSFFRVFVHNQTNPEKSSQTTIPTFIYLRQILKFPLREQLSKTWFNLFGPVQMLLTYYSYMCVRACVRACARVRACAHMCVSLHLCTQIFCAKCSPQRRVPHHQLPYSDVNSLHVNALRRVCECVCMDVQLRGCIYVFMYTHT